MDGTFDTDIPVMIGTVQNEVLLFIYEASKKPINDLEYVGVLEYFFGLSAGSEIISKWPPYPIIGDKRPRLAEVGTKYVFACSTRNFTDNVSAKTKKNVFMYHVHIFNYI